MSTDESVPLILLALALASGCSLDRSALVPRDPGPADAMTDMGLPDTGPRRDTSPPADATLDADSATVADSAPSMDSTVVTDSAPPTDSSVITDSSADSSTVPDGDATADTGSPPDCATVFAGVTGFTAVCLESSTTCVLEIDVTPDRTTCNSVCAEAGWTCDSASGASTARCDVTPIGRCDQRFRSQACVCTAP